MKGLFIFILSYLSISWADDVAIGEFQKANNLLFTPTLYKEVCKTTKGNFLASPLSAEVALAFIQSGCKDETAQEIRKTLGLPDDQSKIENVFKTLLPSLDENDQYILHTANKLYVKKDFEIKDDFKNIAVQAYHSDSENIDFEQKTEAANKMNEWVEKRTENKIHELIESNVLNKFTRVVLINALYFKANWSIPFQVINTEKNNFYRRMNDIVEVDTMTKLFRFLKYYECSNLNAKFIELPFKGGEGSLTIILPNDKEGLTALEDKIDRVFVPHNLTEESVWVKLPKFKIETKIDMEEILHNMGIHKAFDPDEADLSGIAGNKGDLFIDKVKQKTFMDINEEGVEAAAATYVLVPVPTSGFFRKPKQFIADHPFIFYIKIKGIIIFTGRVIDPSLQN